MKSLTSFIEESRFDVYKQAPASVKEQIKTVSELCDDKALTDIAEDILKKNEEANGYILSVDRVKLMTGGYLGKATDMVNNALDKANADNFAGIVIYSKEDGDVIVVDTKEDKIYCNSKDNSTELTDGIDRIGKLVDVLTSDVHISVGNAVKFTIVC